jgi:hypothetical protein
MLQDIAMARAALPSFVGIATPRSSAAASASHPVATQLRQKFEGQLSDELMELIVQLCVVLQRAPNISAGDLLREVARAIGGEPSPAL